jgi:hypothetical protein
VDGDFSSLNIVAEALLKVQMQFGIIPNIRSKGHAARKVLQKMMSMRVEELQHEQAALVQQQSALGKGAGGEGAGMGGAGAAGGQGQQRRSVAEKYNTRSEIDLLVV